MCVDSFSMGCMIHRLLSILFLRYALSCKTENGGNPKTCVYVYVCMQSIGETGVFQHLGVDNTGRIMKFASSW